ncbi:WD40-repeat-containing domain protein [Lentinula lateritia]|nr:WD40-repeat-containing domain protein [Lentinula lateritia]
MDTTYTHISTIDALSDFVHALAFSKDGWYLASASNDRVVRVYDVKHEFTTIWELQGRHPFTALAWRDGGLFVGNMDGDVTLSHPTTKSKLKWIRRRHSEFKLVYKANEPIHVMEFNRRGDHLLVCSGADVMLLKKSKSGIWQYQDRLPRPIPLGETEDKLPPIVATGAYFLESRNKCLIAYLHDGFRIFKIDTWENIRICGSDERLYEKIAASALSPDSTFIIATNLHKGLDWYKIMPDKLKKMSTSCEIQSPGSNIPLPVLFINNGQATIMGMPKGYAVIFEAKHGKREQALKHGGDQTWVTALAYAEPENGCQMIATGDGNCGERTRILIWTENSKDSSSRVSKLRAVLFKIVHMVTNAGYIIFLLMGIVLAMSLLFPTPWTEMDPGGMLEYLVKLTVPATPSPPPTPVVHCAGSSGSSTSIKEILIGLGDLLVCTSSSVGTTLLRTQQT